MQNTHRVSSRLPVDSPIGEEMVIFRSNRGSKKHSHVTEGMRVEIYGKGTASGVALAPSQIFSFKSLREIDIERGYYAKAREPRSNLLSEMSEGKCTTVQVRRGYEHSRYPSEANALNFRRAGGFGSPFELRPFSPNGENGSRFYRAEPRHYHCASRGRPPCVRPSAFRMRSVRVLFVFALGPAIISSALARQRRRLG